MTDTISEAAGWPTFAQALPVWAKIGLLGFGGPAGQIALMHKTVVEQKRWISEDRFLHALNYCMLLPGPEAQQLATYIGWLMHGWRGGIAAGLLFLLPGFVVILGLSSLYAVFHQTAWLGGLFFGLKAAVLAIVIEAVFRIGRRALKTRFHLMIAGMAFAALFVFGIPFPVVVLAAAVAGLAAAWFRRNDPLVHAVESARVPESGGMRPTLWRSLGVMALWIAVWQAPLLIVALAFGGYDNAFAAIFTFFSRMALVTFGGAYAVLSYVAQVAVDHYGWLAPGDMLDGLALAETTPGPLVLVLSFVGFMGAFRNPSGLDPLAAGVLGAALAAWATFVPSFIWIFAGAPYIERLRHNRPLSSALSAITAAVVGVILNLALWFALHVLFLRVGTLHLLSAADGVPLISIAWPSWTQPDLLACGIAALAVLLLFRLRLGMAATLAICGAAGVFAGILR